jgi:hypothetical protein
MQAFLLQTSVAENLKGLNCKITRQGTDNVCGIATRSSLQAQRSIRALERRWAGPLEAKHRGLGVVRLDAGSNMGDSRSLPGARAISPGALDPRSPGVRQPPGSGAWDPDLVFFLSSTCSDRLGSNVQRWDSGNERSRQQRFSSTRTSR